MSADGVPPPGRDMLRWLRPVHRRLVYPALSFVLPSVCFGCGDRLGPLQHLGACPACWSRLRPLSPPVCLGCGLPRAGTTDLLGPARDRCAACLVAPPRVHEVRAAVAYGPVARSFLLRAKLGGVRELFEPLGRQLARTLERAGAAASCDAVVPAPSHPLMNLRRGFRPALELARPVARRLGLPLLPGALRRRALARVAVKRLGRARRRGTGEAILARVRLPVRRVLLVDDVMTTGATVEGCVRALRTAGAERVCVAVWARTLPRFDRPSDGWY